MPPDLEKLMTIIDGGTSNIRAYLCRGSNVLGRGYSQVGAKDTAVQRSTQIFKDGIKTALSACLAGIKKTQSDFLIPHGCIASGMLTSRLGLVDLAHVPAPAGIKKLAGAVVKKTFPELLPCPFYLIPGVSNQINYSDVNLYRSLDSMRGEETQAIGLLEIAQDLPLPALIAFLGSHTKFVGIDTDNKITGSLTTMSGQIFNAIKNHTYLTDYFPDNDQISLDNMNWDDLRAGVRGEEEMGFLRAIHLPRFMDVILKLPKNRCYSYLQGTIIGSDLRSLSLLDDLLPAGFISIIIAGDKIRSEIFRKLLEEKFGNIKNIVSIQDDGLEKSLVMGSMKIYSNIP